MKDKKVFVGLSGGVDSSVSSLLLKRAGYDVVGVYIKGWQPDWIECTWKEERLSALRTATLLDIPFLTLDAEETYKNQVADYMLHEYALGRTPNGDMLCNREVKFGVFLKFALEHAADYVATGHYAQNINFKLYESADKEKDQTYFLSQLTQKELQHILFPIGHLQKLEVRKLAAEAGLPVATRKDSQGICFVGDMSMEEWLKRELNPQKGTILNTKGEVVGEHDGAILYTIGQRHGLNLFNNSENKAVVYVIAKDIDKNTVTVGSEEVFLESENKMLELDQVSFVSDSLNINDTLEVRLRYRGEKLKGQVIGVDQIDDNKKLTIKLDKKVLVANGQFAVFYKDEECLGGGVIG